MPYAERAGVKCYYESFGAGPPLVFIHGITVNHYAFCHQALHFATTHRVILVDLRGHGLSDKPQAGYGIPSLAADVLAVLDDAQVERAILVGNSMGGQVALQLNLDASERIVSNLILSSATDLISQIPPGGPDFSTDFELKLDALFSAAIAERTRRERPEVWDYIRACYRVKDNFEPRVFFACTSDPEGYVAWNISARLHEIKAPTRVLAGAEDRAVPASLTEALAKQSMPNAEYKLVQDVGHYYQLERPAGFNRELHDFLQETPGEG